MTQRIIIADDHPIVRDGLRDLIARSQPIKVMAEARDGVTAERLARAGGADLMVLDVTMPLRSGIQVLEALRADGVMLPILFFTMVPVEQYAAYLRRAGAQGIVGKDADDMTLLAAIRRVLDGGTAFPGAREVASPGTPLSAREIQVLEGLVRGAPLVAIAAQLGVSAASVTTYRRRILEKLKVRSNAELIAVKNLAGIPRK